MQSCSVSDRLFLFWIIPCPSLATTKIWLDSPALAGYSTFSLSKFKRYSQNNATEKKKKSSAQHMLHKVACRWLTEKSKASRSRRRKKKRVQREMACQMGLCLKIMLVAQESTTSTTNTKGDQKATCQHPYSDLLPVLSLSLTLSVACRYSTNEFRTSFPSPRCRLACFEKVSRTKLRVDVWDRSRWSPGCPSKRHYKEFLTFIPRPMSN